MSGQTVTGLDWRETRVEWTILRETREGPVAEAVRRADPAEFSGAGARRRALPGRLTLALPSSQMLLRVLDLPAGDRDEMDGMVGLQIDKVSPFPLENMVIAWERLSERDGQARVVVAAIPMDRLEAACRPALDAGLRPARLDARILGWVACLCEAGEIPPAGESRAMIVERETVEMVVFVDGLPRTFLSLGAVDGEDPGAAARAIAEEAVLALESCGADPAAPTLTRLWFPDEALGRDMAATLSEALPGPVEPGDAARLPPLSEGLARRTLRDDVLNLLPPAWREAAAARRARRRFGTAALGLAAVFLVLFTGGAALQGARQRRTADLRSRLLRLEEPARAMRELIGRIEGLDRYGDRTGSAMETLRDIVARMPLGVELTSFSYRKGATVSLRGQAESPDPVYDFLQSLQHSTLFAEVTPSPVQTRAAGGGFPVQFSVACTFPGSPDHDADTP